MPNNDSERFAYEAGNVIAVTFQQHNGELKKRPAVILYKIPPFDDFLCCGITSKLRHYLDGLDEKILSEDKDFSMSGLRVSSLIRTGFLGYYHYNDIYGVLGSISHERLYRIRKNLTAFIDPDIDPDADNSC